MKSVAQVTLSKSVTAALLVALTVGVFVLDILTPLGLVLWIFYLLPIWMANWFATAIAVPLVATICAGLTLIGWAFSPSGLDPALALLNRVLGVGLFGIVAVFLRVQRRLERDLREQATHLQAVLGHLHEGLITISERGDVELFNPAAERMFGYAAADVIGRNISLLMPEPDRSRHDDYLARYLSTGRAKIIGTGREVIGKRKDGTLFPMELGLAEMRLERGRVFIGSVRDITERKRAEEGLADSQARLQAILDAATEFSIIATDLAGIITTFNIGAERLLGYRAEDMVGRQTPILIHLESEVASREAALSEELGWPVRGFDVFVEYARQGGHEDREWTYVSKDGTHLTVNLVVTALRDGRGVPVGFLGIAKDITERKRSEDALREAERFSRSTLDALSAHIAVLDATGAIIAVNEAWRRFAAENAREPHNVGVGANYLAACDSATGEETDGAGAFAEGLREVLQGRREEFALEYSCHSPTERRWFIGRAGCFREAGPVRVVVAHENITARKLLEDSLRASQAQYRLLVEQAADIIYRTDVNGLFTFVNPVATDIMQYTEEELLGLRFTSLIRPDRRRAADRFYGRQFVRKTPSTYYEFPALRKDGVQIWIGQNVQVLEEHGRVVGFQAVARDITERKQAEAVLKERHRLTELSADLHAAMLMEACLDSMLQNCAEKLIRWLDAAFTRIWLLGPGDLCQACHKAASCDNRNQCLHLTASDGLSRSLDGEYRRVPLGALKIGRIAQGEGPMHTNDVLGDDRLPNKAWLREHGLVAFAGQPLRIGDRVQGVMMIFSRQPLTHAELAGFELAAKTISLGIERKRAEAALRQLNEDLQRQSERLTEANEELESYGQMVSHDLRAPLQGMMGNLGLLQRKLAPTRDETTSRYLERMIDATKQMGQLITDLLAFAQSGQRALDRSMVNLDAVVRAVVADLKPMAEGRDMVWDIASLPTIQGDEVLLRQVFANLLGNAVKYTRFCPKATIAVGVASATDAEAVVFVKDNGAGFDMGHADRLFGTFQRLHSKDQFEGTGIGLSSVRRIVQRHGGRVWAEGAVDHGATFYVSLPRARQS